MFGGLIPSKQEKKFKNFVKENGGNKFTALIYASVIIAYAKRSGIAIDVALYEAENDLTMALEYDPQMFLICNTLPDQMTKMSAQQQAGMIMNRIENGY